MNRKRTLLVGLILGTVAAVIVWRYTSGRVKTPPSAPPTERQKVVVVTRNIEELASLEIGSLELQEKPVEEIPPNAIRSLKEIENFVAARPLRAGEILQRGHLLDLRKLGLAAKIPPGRRAMTLEVDREANVGGVLQPDQFVDVIATFPDAGTGRVVHTVIQRIPILAVFRQKSQKVERDSSGGEEPAEMLVTLGVTPTEAQRLVLADEASSGESGLRLALRPLGEAEWSGVETLRPLTLQSMLGIPVRLGPSTRPSTRETRVAQRPTSRPRESAAGFIGPAPSQMPPVMAGTPSPFAGERPGPEAVESSQWRVKVIRGTAVETMFVDR